MNKYEEAKKQLMAKEIAEKILAMNSEEYSRFMDKLEAEINVINAGVEVTKQNIGHLKNQPIKKPSDAIIDVILGSCATAGFIGSAIGVTNRLAPIDFVDFLLMSSSAIGGAALGLIAGILVSSVCEYNPVGRGIKNIKQHIYEKKLNKLNSQLVEKTLIRDEIDSMALERMGM